MYDKKDGGFKCLGEFLLAAKRVCFGDGRDSRLKTMTEGTDSGGGFLVPEQYEDDLLSVVVERAIVRPRARVISTRSDTLLVPTLVDSSRATNLYGGITWKWTTEGTNEAASVVNPALGQLRLPVYEGIAMTLTSNALEADAYDFGNFFREAFGEAAAFYEDDYFINGTGRAQPLGVMNAPALISVTRSANNNVLAADVAAMITRLLPGSHERAVWLINQTILANIIADPSSTGYGLTDLMDYSSKTLAGIPYVVTEKCAAMGSVGDIILADFSHYVIAHRGMGIKASAHPGFLTNQTYWTLTLRVNGQPLLPAAITPKNGGSTVSPFVALSATS